MCTVHECVCVHMRLCEDAHGAHYTCRWALTGFFLPDVHAMVLIYLHLNQIQPCTIVLNLTVLLDPMVLALCTIDCTVLACVQ